MGVHEQLKNLKAKLARLERRASDAVRLSYVPRALRSTLESTVVPVSNVEYWTWEEGRGFFALAFVGKSNKPALYAQYRSEASRDMAVKTLLASALASAKMKQDREVARKEFRHTLKVGDILYSSWGYDQTNVDWYQVTAASEKAVVIREISAKIVSSDGYGSDKVVPAPGKFIGSPMKKIPSLGNVIKIKSYAYAHVWDGNPKRETSSGWGH